MRPHPRAQRGAATLAIVLVLFGALALVAAYANRTILFEQRAAVNQVRATQAFEAAEAGLEWATAMLNAPHTIGDDCKPASDTPARPFRDRLLRFDTASGLHRPVMWTAGATVLALQASCQRAGDGWACSCPSNGLPSLPAPAAGDAAASFVIGFEAGPTPGSVRLNATGCTRLGGACVTGSADDLDGTARAQVLLSLVPGLAAAPAAPLVARGSVDVGLASIGLHNVHAAAGAIVVDAGGSVSAANARITTAGGASTALAIVEQDESLATGGADVLFARHFGVDRRTWSEQTMVRHLDCASACGVELAAATQGDNGVQLVWVDGDLTIDGAVVVGSPARPVVVVATGKVQLMGNTVVHGVIYGGTTEWRDTTAHAAALRGALISESDHRGNGAPDLSFDPQVIAALMSTTGSFVRVPGSWRDFP